MRYTQTAFVLFALLLQVEISIAQPSKKEARLLLQTSEMNDLMIRYQADRESILRFYSTNGTRSEWWNRQGPDNYNSPERRQRLLKLLADYRKKMTQVDFDDMSQDGKVDWLLFDRKLEDAQFRLEEEDRKYNQIAPYLPFSDRLYTLIAPRRRGAVVNGAQVAKELNEACGQVRQSIAALKKGDSIPSKQANTATAAIGGLQGALKDYYAFYYSYDPLFTWWVPKTYTALDSLLSVYADGLTQKSHIESLQKADGSGIPANPAGEAEVTRQLRLEFIPYSVQELIDLATKEFAWCDAELLKASREMGFGDNWKAAQEKVKNSYVEPGKQPDAMYDLYKQSVDFLKKHDLVTIDPLSEEDWSMFMMSPERQRTSPFFLGGENLIISYPTNTMSYDDKMMSMRGNNPHFSRSTVHHELIAGHHLQGFMTDRYKSYRRFDTPFWVEGHAFYWELVLWDMNFPRSPEDRIGMLFWRMHRCARIILSLNYHLGKWTPQQCIDFLVDRVGHERANAESEVRGYFRRTDYALYQIAYMIGGIQLYALKKELVDGKKMNIKSFNDAILRENSMPIEMLRAILIKQPLKKDFKTNWRFYGK
ncbi:DUF885 family protein [Paraflavitalea soli]|uniref:DUF885 family protein n=1 Tax=Paraflavitalea soli TaxID=2315862 RepID=A0A3B7MKR3_9BACT|nr:DUF885 family protein [Paraflavitalea soli]AXY73700.1 DUF885 family protein [Paraflavitalea soli]